MKWEDCTFNKPVVILKGFYKDCRGKVLSVCSHSASIQIEVYQDPYGNSVKVVVYLDPIDLEAL